MTPEEKKKHELLKQQRAAYKAQQAAERARADEFKRMQEADRREKATDPTGVSSVANKLNFGANTVVFKPPQGGG